MCFHSLNNTISQQSTTNTEQKLWLLMCKWQCIRSFPEQREPLLLILWKLSLSQLLIIIHVSLNFLIIGEWPILFFIHFIYFWMNFIIKMMIHPQESKKDQTQDDMSSLRVDLRIVYGFNQNSFRYPMVLIIGPSMFLFLHAYLFIDPWITIHS